MIVGACVLPSAPLLVPGISPDLPAGVEPIADAVDAAVEQLREGEATVLLAPGPATAVHADARADLAGLGRGDVAETRAVHRGLVDAVAGTLGLPPARGAPLPLGLAVLALLLGAREPLVPVTVTDDADFTTAVAVGAAISDAAGGEGAPDVAVVAAGDLSAGHGPDSPRPDVTGSSEYDARVVDVVDSGRLQGLADLGPEEARRVHAVGWPSLAALHGVLESAKIGLVRRRYAAPCGVGYLVAQGG
jgi:hypothetical protein